jgi:hypothetical protein
MQYNFTPDLKKEKTSFMYTTNFKQHVTRRMLMVSLILISLFNKSFAQVNYTVSGAKLVIEGTSNIHDWEMESNQTACNAVFQMNGNVITGLTSLNLILMAESLKSGKGPMDKNTYKALDTEKNPRISFVATQANVKPNGNNAYTVSAKGKLSISSGAKEVWLAAICTVNADKSITVTGSYKLKMIEYNVTPPSIMFGSIVVGDFITVKYNFVLKPR